MASISSSRSAPASRLPWMWYSTHSLQLVATEIERPVSSLYSFGWHHPRRWTYPALRIYRRTRRDLSSVRSIVRAHRWTPRAVSASTNPMLETVSAARQEIAPLCSSFLRCTRPRDHVYNRLDIKCHPSRSSRSSSVTAAEQWSSFFHREISRSRSTTRAVKIGSDRISGDSSGRVQE